MLLGEARERATVASGSRLVEQAFLDCNAGRKRLTLTPVVCGFDLHQRNVGKAPRVHEVRVLTLSVPLPGDVLHEIAKKFLNPSEPIWRE